MKKKILFYRKVLAVIFGFALFVYIILVPPASILNILLFYLLLFSNLLNLLSLFFGRKRGIFYTLLTIVSLLLSQFNLLNIFNLLILISLAVTSEIYFRKHR